MLFCMDEGPLYVKIGRSRNPYARLQSLSTGCPVRPIQLATCGVRSADKAKRLEKALLAATEEWSTRGEWRELDLGEKQAFNMKWKAVLQSHSDYAWTLKWDTHAVEELERLARERLQLHRARFAKRGRAYQDFIRAQ